MSRPRRTEGQGPGLLGADPHLTRRSVVAGALGRCGDPTGQSRPWKLPSAGNGAPPWGGPAPPLSYLEAGQKPLSQNSLSFCLRWPLTHREGHLVIPVSGALEVRVPQEPSGLLHGFSYPATSPRLPPSSPPSPPLASEHHLSLQPASATPACLLPGKPPPWQPAGIHMTCTCGKERFLPLGWAVGGSAPAVPESSDGSSLEIQCPAGSEGGARR